MPIFEYICTDCRKRFEALVYNNSKPPQCPLCHGTNLDQQISVFAMGASRAAPSSLAGPACEGCACSVPGGPAGCPNLD